MKRMNSTEFLRRVVDTDTQTRTPVGTHRHERCRATILAMLDHDASANFYDDDTQQSAEWYAAILRINGWRDNV